MVGSIGGQFLLVKGYFSAVIFPLEILGIPTAAAQTTLLHDLHELFGELVNALNHASLAYEVVISDVAI